MSFALFLFVGGGLTVAAGVILKLYARREYIWSRVSGTITRSEYGQHGQFVEPQIEYTYYVDGKQYRSDKVWSLHISINLSVFARRAVAKYPVGTVVIVFIDPSDPGNSVLEPGGDKKFLPFMFFVACFWIVIGLRLSS